ncbi:MAG: cell division protein FtsQ [Solirubrobacteraceae bacterium]|jgi:cell division protein FtsQ|nr:cell division protein FtsQ [Solirubrobacteraceae bacterium]
MLSFARRRLRAVLVVATVLVVTVSSGMWLRTSSLVRVKNVTISGIEGRQAAEIRDALSVAALDMTTLAVDRDELRDAVSSYPVVRSLRTSSDFPHGLRIEVNAYDPVAALQPESGSPTAVAADGTLLPGTAAAGLPMVGVRKLPGGARVRDDSTLRAVQLLGAAPAPLRRRVSRVFRGTNGIAATVENGPKLYFGGGTRPRAKWAAVAQVLAHDSSRGASYVDVRIPERPVAGGFQPRPAESSGSTLG